MVWQDNERIHSLSFASRKNVRSIVPRTIHKEKGPRAALYFCEVAPNDPSIREYIRARLYNDVRLTHQRRQQWNPLGIEKVRVERISFRLGGRICNRLCFRLWL